jgi:uncharacterized protein GlcG (DUF336 family)
VRSAWAAAAEKLAERAQANPAFVNALTAASDGRVIPVPRRVLVRNANDELLGAVGISGDGPDKDELCAVAGIEAASLRADPG